MLSTKHKGICVYCNEFIVPYSALNFHIIYTGNDAKLLLRLRKSVIPLQNSLRVSRMFQWNPAVMLCAYVVSTYVSKTFLDSASRAHCVKIAINYALV